MTFGEWLRSLRLKAELSQKGLGEAVGFTQSYVSALERRKKAPNEFTLKVLENYFKVSYYNKPTSEDEKRSLELARYYLSRLRKEWEDGN